jgi:hypothetical protein
MAIANVGTRGTQVSAASGTTIARAPSATVAVDRILVCQIAQNGNQNTTVTDAQGNTWEFLGSGSGTNARSDIWIARITTRLTTADNVTVTFAGAVVHKSMLLWEFSVTAGNKLVESTTEVPNSTTGVNGFGSVNFAGLPSIQRLYLRALAKQANITTAITSVNSFTSQALTIRSQNNASAIAQRGEYRINTSTGETSNPTLASTGNTGNVFVALEEFAPPATQSLTQASRFDNTATFYAATVTAGAVALTQATRYDNDPTFYAATVSQSGGGQSLTQNTRYDNGQVFYGPTVTRGAVTLTPALYSNTQTFFAPTVGRGPVTLTPVRYDNGQTFYAATVARGPVTLTATRFDNASQFYSAFISQGGAGQSLLVNRFDNTNQFFGGLTTLYITFPDFVEPGHVEPGWVGWPYFNAQTFFPATLTGGGAPTGAGGYIFTRRRRRC